MKSVKNFAGKFYAAFEIIRIVVRTEPAYLIYFVPQIILSAALPVLYVYFPRIIIEQLTGESPYREVAATIILFACILLLINLANVLLRNKCTVLNERITAKIRKDIGAIVTGIEISGVESAHFRNIIQLAGNMAGLTRAIEIIKNIITNIITAASLAFIIIRLNFIFTLLVLFTLIIKILLVRKYMHFRKVVMRERNARNERMYLYSNRVRQSEGGAKEIRVNNLQDWIMAKVKYFRKDLLNIQFRETNIYHLYDIITQAAVFIQSFVILFILAQNYFNGGISIAEFIMYFTAVTSLTATLTAIAERTGDYGNQVLDLDDYKKLVRALATESTGNSVHPVASESTEMQSVEIIFKDVSFTYPNTDRKVLDNINLTVKDKEKLVIVGFNGAGKSTFIKLLCKFYRPSSGVISLNGVDIWDIPNSEYYKIIGAVFQDFSNFAFSVGENIAMSEDLDMQKAGKILEDIDILDYVKELPDAYNTCISKNFDSGGIELSGGQGQKLAIARAVYKDTPVLILDEPTANLDPKAESEIYKSFFDMSKEKTTIFISHRLAASTVADNIAVFSDGRIEEYGPHDALTEKDGIYAEMYRKQSLQYNSENLSCI